MKRVLALVVLGLLLGGYGIVAQRDAAEQPPAGIWVQTFQRLELAADGTGSQTALASGPSAVPLRWEAAAPDTIRMELQWTNGRKPSVIDGTWRIEHDQLMIVESENGSHRYIRWHDEPTLTRPDDIRAALVGNAWRTPYNFEVDDVMEFAADGTMANWRSDGSNSKSYGTWQLVDGEIVLVIDDIHIKAVLMGGSQLRMAFEPHGVYLYYGGVPKP